MDEKCRLITMLVMTGGLFGMEMIAGYVTNSTALVADSFHMLSDVIALGIAYMSVEMSPKKWSKNTFGWARAEVLGALVNSVFLAALVFSVSVEALKRLFNVEEIREPGLVALIGVIGLLVNLVGLALLHDHGHSHRPSQSSEKSVSQPAFQMNMRGVFLHVLADAIGSVIVIISASIIWLTRWEYRFYVDPILSLVLVGLIMKAVWPLLRDSALILLQTVPTHIQVTDIEMRLMSRVEGVLGVHEFHVWQLAGDRIIASAHIRCKDLSEYMKLAGRVKEFFHNEGIHSTTIQPEFVGSDPDDGHCICECVLDCPKTDVPCAQSTCCGPSRPEGCNHPSSEISLLCKRRSFSPQEVKIAVHQKTSSSKT